MSAQTPSADDAPIGTTRELIRDLGCGACHAGVPDAGETIRDRAPPLGSAGRPLEFGFLVEFLRDPHRLRQDIGRSRMPDFHLDERESLALALFLTRGRRESPEPGPDRASERTPDVPAGLDAELGREIFVALNCAGCHRHPEVEPRRNAPDLSGLRARVRPAWLRRWLASPSAVRPFGHRPGTGGRMPDFRLDRPEVDSLADHLLSGSPSAEADARAGSSGTNGRNGFEPRELSAFERRKAETLLRDRLSCLGCHRLEEEGGRIGPDLTAAGDRLRPGYLHAVIRDPELAAPGTVMPKIPTTSERRRLIASFLAAGNDPEAAGANGRAADDDDAAAGEGGAAAAGEANGPLERAGYLSLVDHPLRPPPPASDGIDSPAGGELYAARCAACHGAEGEGDGYNARYLPVRPTVHASASYISTRPDATLFDGIHAGGRILDRSHRMPPFGESLDPDRIGSLVDHIRALCDCEGPPWSR